MTIIMQAGYAPGVNDAPTTRARVLDGAARVFGERGYHGASVAEIARAAGFSVGAVYSNFAGKDEVFEALMEEHLDWLGEVLAAEGAPDQVARAWMAYLRDNRERFTLFVEFWAYAMRNEAFRARFAARLAGIRALLADRVAAAGRRSAPPETLAVGALALAHGVALQKLADPDGVDDAEFERLVALLLLGDAGSAAGG